MVFHEAKRQAVFQGKIQFHIYFVYRVRLETRIASREVMINIDC
jgi:hypothetical protein